MAGTQETADMQIALRLPASFIERADALVARLASSKKVMVVGRLTRSAVLKLAIEQGLEALEQQHR